MAAIALAAVAASLAFGNVDFPKAGAPAPTPHDLQGAGDTSTPAEPIAVHLFDGTIETSFVPEEPAPTQVILGPTSKNDVKFDIGTDARYIVMEVSWESDDIQQLGGVLYQRRLDLGPIGEETLFGWDYLTYHSGPSPLYLATPIGSEGRYSWSVYPMPGQTIVHLDFKSAISVFADAPPADYRVFVRI